MIYQIYLIVLENLSLVNHFYLTGQSQWFKVRCRGCIVGTREQDVFGPKFDTGPNIIIDFYDIQDMLRLKELELNLVRLWCM